FPTSPHSLLGRPLDDDCVRTWFAAKLASNGSGLDHSALIVPSDGHVTGTVVDERGYAYISGYTLEEDFPVTSGALAKPTAQVLSTDGVLAIVNAQGT